MRQLFLIFAIIAFASTTTHAQKFRTHGNTTFSSPANWENYIGGFWSQSEIIPSCLHDTIFILQNDTAMIDCNVAIDQIVVENGGTLINTWQMGKGLNKSFMLFNGNGNDLTIKNGGKYIHDMDTVSALPSGNGSILIERGGMIQINNNRNGGFADYYANDEDKTFAKRLIWCDSAIFFWNTNGFLSTVNTTYFPNADSVTIPILRFSGTAVNNGSNNDTRINGLLIVDTNKTFVLTFGGKKIFRNGIINHGTIKQTATSGALIIGTGNAIFKNTGTLELNNNSIEFGDSTSVSSIKLLSNIDFNNYKITIWNTSIVFGNWSFKNASEVICAQNSNFIITHEFGFDNCLAANTILKRSNLLTISLQGEYINFAGNTFPTDIKKLSINTLHSVQFSKDIRTEFLQLKNGKLDFQDYSLSVTNTTSEAIEQESDTSYVIGRLQRNVTNNCQYEYPVGSVKYQQKVIVNLVESSDLQSIAIIYKDSIVSKTTIPNLTLHEHPIESFLDNGFWRIEPNENYTSVEYDLQIQLNKKSLVYTPDITKLGIVKRELPTDAWGSSSQGIVETSSEDDNYIFLESSSILSFSDAAIATSQDQALPINLLSFRAETYKNKTSLFWETCSETNSNSFEIYRSIDAETFCKIGSCIAAGNSCSVKEYMFEDKNRPTCILYYKLKQIDNDGTILFSNMISVENINNKIEYKIKNGQIIFERQSLSQNNYAINITSAEGKIISNYTTDQDAIDLSFLQSGFYMCKIRTNNNEFNIPFCKQ